MESPLLTPEEERLRRMVQPGMTSVTNMGNYTGPGGMASPNDQYGSMFRLGNTLAQASSANPVQAGLAMPSPMQASSMQSMAPQIQPVQAPVNPAAGPMTRFVGGTGAPQFLGSNGGVNSYHRPMAAPQPAPAPVDNRATDWTSAMSNNDPNAWGRLMADPTTARLAANLYNNRQNNETRKGVATSAEQGRSDRATSTEQGRNDRSQSRDELIEQSNQTNAEALKAKQDSDKQRIQQQDKFFDLRQKGVLTAQDHAQLLDHQHEKEATVKELDGVQRTIANLSEKVIFLNGADKTAMHTQIDDLRNRIPLLTQRAKDHDAWISGKLSQTQPAPVAAPVTANPGWQIGGVTPHLGITVTNDADYAALPLGAQYTAPDGTLRTKR